jgi:hypothetical protein
MRPFFSLVIADCDSVVTKEERVRFIESLKAQTFKDFELILMHDGARVDILDIDFGTLDVKMEESLFRARVGGDNLRTPGMKKATGLYILNNNIDNFYYPNALQDLYNFITSNQSPDVVIAKVKMMGMKDNGGYFSYDNPRDYSKHHILTGYPPIICKIDIMNLTARKEVFEATNYWYDDGNVSDGVVYENICKKYKYLYCDTVLGEHY